MLTVIPAFGRPGLLWPPCAARLPPSRPAPFASDAREALATTCRKSSIVVLQSVARRATVPHAHVETTYMSRGRLPAAITLLCSSTLHWRGKTALRDPRQGCQRTVVPHQAARFGDAGVKTASAPLTHDRFCRLPRGSGWSREESISNLSAIRPSIAGRQRTFFLAQSTTFQLLKKKKKKGPMAFGPRAIYPQQAELGNGRSRELLKQATGLRFAHVLLGKAAAPGLKSARLPVSRSTARHRPVVM